MNSTNSPQDIRSRLPWVIDTPFSKPPPRLPTAEVQLSVMEVRRFSWRGGASAEPHSSGEAPGIASSAQPQSLPKDEQPSGSTSEPAWVLVVEGLFCQTTVSLGTFCTAGWGPAHCELSCSCKRAAPTPKGGCPGLCSCCAENARKMAWIAARCLPRTSNALGSSAFGVKASAPVPASACASWVLLPSRAEAADHICARRLSSAAASESSGQILTATHVSALQKSWKVRNLPA
mmetsp:Transcript_109134/g.307680  ORF Transcript_109134/g.307680 Transcript_109134/m.307680 type:complete len:233 (-) Transcript_109134:243-941(-)